MRIRILNALTGVMDGQSLSQFLPGYVYEVTEVFGAQLVAMGGALEVRATDPAVDDDLDMARLTGGVHVITPDKADDRPHLRPKPDRRKTRDRRKATRTERRS